MECMLQAIQGGKIIADVPIAGSQRAVAARYLIDIAVLLEDVQRTFGQVAGKQGIGVFLGIDEQHRRAVTVDQQVAALLDEEMFAHSLQGIGLPEDVAALEAALITTHQIIPLLLHDLVGRTFGKNTAGAYLVEVVQVLGRILLYRVLVNLLQGRDALRFESHVIIIGRSHDMELALGIDHTVLQPLGKGITLL